MPSEKVRIPEDLIKWCIEYERPRMNINFEPTVSQIITHALRQHIANMTGQEYEVPENYVEYKFKRK